MDDPHEQHEQRVRTWLLHRLGLRVGPRTAAYVLRHLNSPDPLPVMAGDARTGVPVRRVIDPEALKEVRSSK